MSESEKAEQDVAAARVVERIAEWKAMETKASYYHYASKAMEASAEVMGARIRRDNAIAAEFADKAFALAETPASTEVRKQDEQDAAGDWTNGGEDRLDAVCAELLAAPPPAQEAPAIPEGFIPWGGGEYLPVARGTPLVVLYRNGSEVDCTAGDEMSEFWHRSSTLVDHSPDHDIIAYRVIETGETQSELDSSQIEGGDRVEPLHDRPKLTNEEFESLEKIDGVLDAEPSPILRSEVPPAAETYLAPSGDEFATVNGQTHLIVSDEAEAQGQAETAPQAAYAPIHNEDEPSDAAVFAHGLNVELDQKAEPKRFGIWGIEFGHAKQKADA